MQAEVTAEQLAALETATARVRTTRQIDEHVRRSAALANVDLHLKSTRRVPYAARISTGLTSLFVRLVTVRPSGPTAADVLDAMVDRVLGKPMAAKG